MLEDIRKNIEKLVALYEAEKRKADALSEKLAQSEQTIKDCRERITELDHQIDNLTLQNAFSASGDNEAAKKRIDKLVREIDKCIKCLED